MKYSVVKVVNGNYAIVAEYSVLQSAIVGFHNNCMTHWNAADVYDATIAILDENLDVVNGYKEHIYHERPEETVEETTEE